MKLIVGLGNPGEKYEKTRHNLGFMILERFLRDFEPVKKTEWENSGKFKSDIAELEWERKHHAQDQEVMEKVLLAKPKTYMNNSGMAVSIIARFYKIEPSDIWILHDDIDLPTGALRVRFGGGSAGHHGIESIMQVLGTEKFWRFRLGIGNRIQSSEFKDQTLKKRDEKIRDADDFVLGTFSHGEKGKIKELIKHGSKALREGLENGLAIAANKFNTR